MAPSSMLMATLLRLSQGTTCDSLDEQSMLQMDFKRAADLAADQDMGQVVNYALLDTACRCPGYYEEQCLAEAAQGCYWDYDNLQQTGKWCQCGEPQPVDPDAQAPVAICPAGWEQQGDAGADIGGCGIGGSCSDRYDITSEANCAARCDATSQCASFSFAPMNGDRNHPGVTACTLYDSATPTGTWTGTQGIATQVMCARADATNSQPFFTGFWNGNRNNWNGDVGYDFRANDDISITHLGRALFNGALREFAMVSLWSTQTQALLASVSVGPSSHVDGNYAYEVLPSPVQLQSGQEYRITQQCHNGMPDSWYDASEFALTQANGVATFIGGVYRSGNGYPLNNDGAYRRPGMLNFLFGASAAPAPAPAPFVPDFSTIRLSGGPDQNSGRLEVFHNNEWGTVCDDAFDMNDAQVACRQMGFARALTAYNRAHFGPGSGQIWLDNMGCNGQENTITECPGNAIGQHNCGHHEDVGVRCSALPYFTDLRLNGGTSTRGRLEIFYDDQWGTICDDEFDMNDAEVACRELGFSRAVAHIPTFGGGEGQIWLDNMRCDGSEATIDECPNLAGWGSHNCGHNEDVGVECA